MMKKVILIDSNTFPNNYIKNLKIKFRNIKLTIIHHEDIAKLQNEIINANVLINCPRKIFKKELVDKSKNLEWVHTSAAGVDEYLFSSFIKSNIQFSNGKILQGPEIADHGIGLLLSISRNIHYSIKNVEKKNMPRPIELNGKKCGIIGMGGIGMCLAERLKKFGMTIISISEDLVPILSCIDEQHDSSELIKLLPSFDVIFCAAPLTKHSNKMFNEAAFKKMKTGSIFINVSRGELVDTNALLKNNLYKKFKGIGLDVVDGEPLPNNHKLKKAKNVVLTEHIAGLSDNNRARAYDLITKNIERFLKKKPLFNLVDKIKGY